MGFESIQIALIHEIVDHSNNFWATSFLYFFVKVIIHFIICILSADSMRLTIQHGFALSFNQITGKITW